MADDWIHRRYQSFQERIAVEQKQHRLEQKALHCYDAMFDALKERVDADVGVYNKLFADHKACMVFLQPDINTGFSVACRTGSTKVLVQPTTSSIIKIDWGSDITKPPERSDTLEIVADDQGEIRYKHGKEILSNVSDASQIILDPVLCR